MALKKSNVLVAAALVAACGTPPTGTDGGSDARSDSQADTTTPPADARDGGSPPADVTVPEDVITPMDVTVPEDVTTPPTDVPAVIEAGPEAAVDSGPVCPMGLMACGGSCIDTSADPMNCGACGTACPMGQVCAMGTCGCPMGRTSCGGACVDTAADPMNCGTCGTT
jgi:hypothetical protein